MIQCALILAGLLASGLARAGAVPSRPSRAPVKGCAWRRLSDGALGLEAWVQRCDFGFRKIDFLVVGNSLALRYSDGGAPDRLVDVLDLLPGESAETGIRRIFAARTDKALAGRCVLAPSRETKSRVGVERFTFVPDAAYRKALDAKADPNEVPEPPCGDWGDAPDGIQYFEAQPASSSRKVLFVRVGQDEPLFDEKTLRLLR
ncbi:MAG: hypothetical protein ACRD16_14510 [Thermoanaerobaculia bacterium]